MTFADETRLLELLQQAREMEPNAWRADHPLMKAIDLLIGYKPTIKDKVIS